MLCRQLTTFAGRKVAGENDLFEKKLAAVVKKVRVPKPKKKKDSKKCTPYTEFVKETCPKLRKENPTLPFSQLGNRLRDIWLELSPPEYERYKAMHAAAVANAVIEAARELGVDTMM